MKNVMLILLICCAGAAFAQSSQEVQYAAYLSASKTLWEKSIELAKKENGEGTHQHVLAIYGLLNNTMVDEDQTTFDDYVDTATDYLEALIKSEVNPADQQALLSSVYGLIMAYSPMKGMFLGMKSTSLIEEALKQQPTSPLVQKLYAGSKLYTPEMFGGDPEEAVESFSVSIELYEGSQTQSNNWLYLDALMGLSMAYRKTDQPEKAVEVLKKALKVEPDYKWAEAVLAKLEKS